LICHDSNCNFRLCLLCWMTFEEQNSVNRHLEPICTLPLTGVEDIVWQEVYNCHECGVIGCCYACAVTCHAGHDISFPTFAWTYCGCVKSNHDCKHAKKWFYLWDLMEDIRGPLIATTSRYWLVDFAIVWCEVYGDFK
jgi:hypothetical protein